ncbi:hypothetical protein EV174_002710, partial [Coemansia sp. RSA 2320]
CTCCGYECDCVDLYYDHILFDSRHHEMAQREQAMAPTLRRMSRNASRSRSSLLKRTSHGQIEQPKQACMYNSTT